MSASFDLESPDYFTAGAVGAPGQRVFYLQAREAGSVVTLKAEKEQVRALGDYLGVLLGKLPAAGEEVSTDLPLLEPVQEAWIVGSIGVGYDDTRDRILIVVNETVEEGAEEEGATANFRITRSQATAFVEQVRSLVKAGRPICRLCDRPIDPEGHVCPRANGHFARHE